MTAPAPLTYPLAGLISEPVGTSRRYDVAGTTIPLPNDLRLTEPLEGEVRIALTNRGVLVEAHLEAAIAGACSRCLRDIEIPIAVDVNEEALPSVDLASGRAVDTTAEPEVTRLTAHHELELGPLVADAISLAEPIAPLCEEACAGLCPTCGERLGPEHEPHQEDEIDPRLAGLRDFRAADVGVRDDEAARAADVGGGTDATDDGAAKSR